MAKDSSDKGDGVGPQRPRRKPTTIDLPAEEVGRKPPPAAETTSPQETAATGPEPAKAEAPQTDAPQTDAPKTDAPKPEVKPTPPKAAAADTKSGGAIPPQRPAPPAAPAAKHDSATSFVPLVVAAVLGGVLVALVVVLLARGGFFLPAADTEGPDLAAEIETLKSDIAALQQSGAEDRTAPLRQDMDSLRKSVAALEDREPVPAPDNAAIETLRSRVDALAQDVAALKSTAPADSSAGASEIAALRRELDTLTTRVDGLSGDSDVASQVADLKTQVEASAARLDGMPSEERVAALETKLSAAEKKIDAAETKIDDAAALAPAVAADALAAAIEAGRPFGAELQALRRLGVDQATLDSLAPEADKGLPTLASLGREFETAIASVDLSSPIPEGAGVMDRLMQSARGLVEVRPAHPTEGSDPEAVVTRIRGALAAGDLDTALKERDALPDAAKAATADWAAKAAARRDADDLVAQLRAEALSRLEAGE